jgi:hypothetical protein
MTRNALAPRAARPAARSAGRSAVLVRAALPGARQGHFRSPKFTRDLGEWSEGVDVKALQQSLGTMRQDGVFGAETVAAVKLWQRANGISSTGYFGPQSRAKWEKTNGGVRPSWASTAVVVQPHSGVLASRVAGVADFTGPALLGGFVLAAILKAQDDPLGFEGIFKHATAKFTAVWGGVSALLFGVQQVEPEAGLAAEGAPSIVPSEPSAEPADGASWAEYEKEADTRVWSWGTPGFHKEKVAREKRRAALNHAVAASMRGPSMSQDMHKFATFEFSDFVRAQETVDPEERQARREELDKKFRERRGLDITAGSPAMQNLQRVNADVSSNVVAPETSQKIIEVPFDVSSPVLGDKKSRKASTRTKQTPRSLPKGFVPASSPSAMAAYEKMIREMEAAEEQSAEKSGPR